jgi:hypothetical protein
MAALHLIQVTTANSTPGRWRVDLGIQRRDYAPGLFHGVAATSGLLAAEESQPTGLIIIDGQRRRMRRTSLPTLSQLVA